MEYTVDVDRIQYILQYIEYSRQKIEDSRYNKINRIQQIEYSKSTTVDTIQ